MVYLVKNELTKIFKRKNILIFLCIGFLIIFSYNLIQKFMNTNLDIHNQYIKAYNNDKLLIENSEQTIRNVSYTDIQERMILEKYAIDNNIKYNILLNSSNSNISLPIDARYMLLKFFDFFELVIVFLILYTSSTVIYEEFLTGTINYLIIKPYSKFKIIFSKILSTFLTITLYTFALLLFQYFLGGLLFGFDSYELDMIYYNYPSNSIKTIELACYIFILLTSKILFMFLLSIIGMLFSMITHNIPFNILLLLGLYMLSKLEILINPITKYLFMFNWDFSKYLFKTNTIFPQLIISIFTIIIVLILLFLIFKNKDINNE